MKILTKLFLFAFLTCSFFDMSAQVLAGGEIYYELIAAKKYKITAHVYRMCDQAALNTLNANVYGDTVVRAMSFQRIVISKINDTCGNPCNKQNAVSNAGFEKHTFIDTIDFNIAPYNVFVSKSICVVNFGIHLSGRYLNPTTHDTGQFYLDASTNICLSNIAKNSSPEFSIEPKFFAGCNLPVWYSPGPRDTLDNDSFVFSLVSVQSNYKANLAYKGSFNANLPMTPFCLPPGVINCKPLPNAKPPRGFYFDDKSCQIGFTPSVCNEKGTIKFKIDEYRFNKKTQKYEWLGFVTREMFLQVMKLPDNNTPQIFGANQFSVCSSNLLCLTERTRDIPSVNQKIADTTYVFWDKGIKNGKFRIKDTTVREREVEFCWNAIKSANRLERFFFTIGAYDKQCNTNLVSSTIIVNVRPLPKYTYKNTLGKCGQIKWNATVYDSMYPEYKGTCNTRIISFLSNKVLYASVKLFDSMNLHQDEKVIIEHTFNINTGVNCPLVVQDTVTITGTFQLPDINDNKDSIICRFNKADFRFQKNKVINLSNFKWYHDGTLVNQTDTMIVLRIFNNSQIKLLIENTNGCLAERILNYTLKQHDAILNPGQNYCYGDTVRIKANLNSLKLPVYIFWKKNGRDTASGDTILNIIIKSDLKVYVQISDDAKCSFVDSSINMLFPKVNFKLKGSGFCKDSIQQITASELTGTKPYNFYWNINNNDTLVNDTMMQLNGKLDSKVVLKIEDKNYCVDSDSVNMTIIPTPEVILMPVPQACVNSTVTIVPIVANRPSVIDYQWRLNKAIISNDSVLKRKVTTNELLILKVSNSQNCSTEDSIDIVTYPFTPLLIFGKTNYHPSSFITLYTIYSYRSYQWFNGKTNASDSFWASELGPPGKYFVWCKAIDNNGCEYLDTIEINTNQFLSISQYHEPSINIYPNPVNDVLTIENNEAADVKLFSADGRLVNVYKLLSGRNELDLSSNAKGFYFLQTSMTGKQKIIKIIKE